MPIRDERPELPDHYRAAYRFFLRFALVMLVFGGVAGVLFQESTKSLGYDEIAPGLRLEAFYHLALLHGHAFLIGALMPVAWIVILDVAHRLGAERLGARSLWWIRTTYAAGAASTLALITYKGLHFVAAIRSGERDFAAIHDSLFGGQRLVRGLAYGVSHTVATVGLFIFVWVVWRKLGRSRVGSGGHE